MTTEVPYIGADGNPRLMPEGMGEKLGFERAAVQTPPELQEGGGDTSSDDNQSDAAADKALITQLQDDKQKLQNDIVERDNTIADLKEQVKKAKQAAKDAKAGAILDKAGKGSDENHGTNDGPVDPGKEKATGAGTSTPTGQQ